MKGIVKQLTSILDGVEDRLEDISELFEDAVDKGKRDVQRQVVKVKKRMMREVREEGSSPTSMEKISRRVAVQLGQVEMAKSCHGSEDPSRK